MDKDQIIGTWRLMEFRMTDSEGNVRNTGTGTPNGRIIYAADGNMGLATLRGDGACLSYFGRYEFHDDHVIHHIELSSDPRLMGTEQRRDITFDDGRLVLKGSPGAAGDPTATVHLVWERT